MRYYVEYKGTRLAKETKAVQDIKDYLGENWLVLSDKIRISYSESKQENISTKRFIKTMIIALSIFQGISGYPALPFIKYALRGNNVK